MGEAKRRKEGGTTWTMPAWMIPLLGMFINTNTDRSARSISKVFNAYNDKLDADPERYEDVSPEEAAACVHAQVALLTRLHEQGYIKPPEFESDYSDMLLEVRGDVLHFKLHYNSVFPDAPRDDLSKLMRSVDRDTLMARIMLVVAMTACPEEADKWGEAYATQRGYTKVRH